MSTLDLEALSAALAETPRAPCEDCVNFHECATRLLACTAFHNYVDGGRLKGAITREPTRATYRAIFPEQDDVRV